MKESQNAVMTQKLFLKIIDDLFRHKRTKLPAYSSAQDLANRFATFFKEKTDKVRDELPDCSDIDLNIPQHKPPSTPSNHNTGGGMEDHM